MSAVGHNKELLIRLRLAINALPPAQREATQELAQHIRRYVSQDPNGWLAVALIGTELELQRHEKTKIHTTT